MQTTSYDSHRVGIMTPQYEPQTLHLLFSSSEATAAAGAPGPEPSTETAIRNETRPNKYFASHKRYQSKLLCGCDNNSQSSLNAQRSESHSPCSVRRYWGQPAQRMKQMKSFRWDAHNPVLTTVVRPPRRLHPGRGSLSRLFEINEERWWHAQSLNCPPPVIFWSTKAKRSSGGIRRRGESIYVPLFSRFPLMPVALWTH